jgi:hypothetical protein
VKKIMLKLQKQMHKNDLIFASRLRMAQPGSLGVLLGQGQPPAPSKDSSCMSLFDHQVLLV